MNYENVNKAYQMLNCLKNKAIKKTYELFESYPQREFTVTEVMIHIRKSQPMASQNLKVLRRNGWLTWTKDGKEVYYRLNMVQVVQSNKALNQFSESYGNISKRMEYA